MALLATPRDADVPVDNEVIAALDRDEFDDGAALLSPRLSSASRRLRALAELSGSLTDALSPDDAAIIVQREALVALEASSAVVVTRGAFPPPVDASLGDATAPAKLNVLHAIGLSEAVLSTVRGAPIDSSTPLAVVARLGDAIFMATPHAIAEHGAWGEAMRAGGARAAAIVPVWANGELRGVLGLGWNTNQVFGEDDRAFVSTLGIMCAQALMRAHLRSAERAAREEAQEARVVAERLSQALAATRGVVLRVSGPVPELQITVDPRKLRQMLVDLMADAVKHTDEKGQVMLTVHLEGLGNVVSLELPVIDTGREITR